MRRLYGRLGVVCTLVGVVLSTIAASAATPRVLLVGDSWAHAVGDWDSFTTAFADDGLTQWSVTGDQAGTDQTAIPGSFASEWVNPATGYLDRLDTQLANNPTIDIIHLSLGGNDFIWNIDGSKTPSELAAFYQGIADNIQAVVEHILAVRPSIHIGINSYDYMTYFNGTTTKEEANTLQVDFSHYLKDVADTDPRCVFIDHLGLMQHHFGISGVYAPGALPAPGGPPDYTPFSGGDLNYPGVSLHDWIHLNEAGYVVLAHNCLDQAYTDWLTTVPHVAAFVALDPSPTASQSLRYRIDFTEPVTGVDKSDFTLSVNGEIIGASISAVYGSGTRYYILVDRGLGSGDVSLALIDDHSITMATTAPLNGAGTGTLAGPTYAVALDQPLPLPAWPMAVTLALTGIVALLAWRRRCV